MLLVFSSDLSKGHLAFSTSFYVLNVSFSAKLVKNGPRVLVDIRNEGAMVHHGGKQLREAQVDELFAQFFVLNDLAQLAVQLLIAVLDEGLAAELLDDFVARSEDFLAKGLAHVRLKDGPVARDLRHLVCFQLRDELAAPLVSFDNLGNFFAIGFARLH